MKPMNLKYLPNYLKRLKEKNQFDENLVVDMGKISTTQTNFKAAFLFLFLFVAFSGIFLITNSFNKNFTIVLNTNEIDSKSLATILKENGAEIVSIREVEKSFYEVKIKRAVDLKELIENLKKIKSLKNVEITKFGEK